LAQNSELALTDTRKKQLYPARYPLQTILAIIIGVTLVLFVVTPIIYVLIRSFGGAEGFTLDYYRNFFARPYYYKALTNSLTLATTVTSIIVVFCFMYAYIVSRLPKGILATAMRSIALLPLLAPPFIFSISLITLGGRRGIISQMLLEHFGIEFSIYGWTGVILAQCIGLFPLGFMMLENVLRSMDLNL
jgi:iron(III) transport system permease protein